MDNEKTKASFKEAQGKLTKLHKDYAKILIPRTFGRALDWELSRMEMRVAREYGSTLILEADPVE